jgi:uncharacterized protein YggE
MFASMLSHRNVIRLCLLAVFVFAAAPADAQMQDYPSVTVTGEASVHVAPDRAIVRAGVTSQGKTARDAMTANNKAMGAVLLALKEQGISDADVQTSRLSLDAIRSKDGAQPVAGFQAANGVSVTVRDVGKVGDILDRVVSAGANSIGGIDFVVSNYDKLLDKVRADAVADAKRKAEIYVQAAGVGLGRPITISEQGAPVRPMMRKMAAPAAGAAVPISAGEEQITISVAVSYELMR